MFPFIRHTAGRSTARLIREQTSLSHRSPSLASILQSLSLLSQFQAPASPDSSPMSNQTPISNPNPFPSRDCPPEKLSQRVWKPNHNITSQSEHKSASQRPQQINAEHRRPLLHLHRLLIAQRSGGQPFTIRETQQSKKRLKMRDMRRRLHLQAERKYLKGNLCVA